MKGLFALTDTSMTDADIALCSTFTTGTYGPDTKLDELDVLYIPTVARFTANAKVMKDYAGVVIIFDCPARCDSILGLTLLDVKERDESFRYTFERITPEFLLAQVEAAVAANKDVEYDTRTSNMLPYLLSRTSCSQLDRIQTWKYRIRDVTLRDEAVAALIKWFFAPKPTLEDLTLRLMKMLSCKREQLNILLKDSKFETLKAAILDMEEQRRVKKTPPAADKVAEKHGVSAFDIRYLTQARNKLIAVKVFEPGVALVDVRLAAIHNTKSPLDAQDELDEIDEDLDPDTAA